MLLRSSRLSGNLTSSASVSGSLRKKAMTGARGEREQREGGEEGETE